MSHSAKSALLALAAIAVIVSVVPAIASAGFVISPNGAIDATIYNGTAAAFTAAGIITVTCDTHTMRGTITGGASVTIASADNVYTDTSIGGTNCPTDVGGVTALVTVTNDWSLLATGVNSGSIDTPDAAATIRLSGGVFNCSATIQRSTINYMLSPSTIKTDANNNVNTTGSGGSCIFPGPVTQSEKLLLYPSPISSSGSVVISPDATLIDGTLSAGTTMTLTFSGAFTFRCDTHTSRATTGIRSNVVTIRARDNTYTDTSLGGTRCTSDMGGVTESITVATDWTLAATRTTGGYVTVPDGAVRMIVNGGAFGGCSMTVQRSTIKFTYSASRLQTDPGNAVNIRGSGGSCVVTPSPTLQETLILSPAITLR